MSPRHATNPSTARTFPGMSQAVSVDGLVFLSGQVAQDRRGRLVGIDDATAQAHQIFANIAESLTAHETGLSDVTKLTCYATSRDAYEAYAAVKTTLYPIDGPAATTVIVAGLLDDRMLLEVDVIAVRPSPDIPTTSHEGAT